MRISNKGIDLIKKYEGCRLKAYKDPAGVPTIGYGHTAGVKSGDVISQEQADELLRDDLVIFEQKVMKYDEKYHWNQNQFDALVSFCYNIGNIDQLTSNGRRNISTISNKILEYNKAGGKALPGLTRRRKEEKVIFDTPVEAAPAPEAPKEEPKPEPKPAPQPTAKYIVGKVYTVKVNTALNVRKSPNGPKVGYNGLTPDGRKHANKSGALLNGTKVTCNDVKTVGSETWIKIPSGWCCAKTSTKTFIK